MTRLAKYLKPFIPMILLAIVLLFVQALSDLTLPDYMSNIVNNGIQQSGIVNAVPEAIRLNEMNKITLFMSENDKAEVLKNYTLIDNASSDYDKYLKKYPQLEKEPVFVLNKTDKKELVKINPLMGKAFLAVSGIKQIIKDPKTAAAAGSNFGFDLSKLPSGITSDQIFAMLA
ncbi:MAG: ABC transporter ATP-binding protein, partial [Candidatus Humimicrobiaceae bacterium]